MTKKDINKLFVDTINSYFTKEGLTSKPKRENTRTSKVGRRHRVKYDRVMLTYSKQIKYVFKIIDIEDYCITVKDIEELNKEGNDYNV